MAELLIVLNKDEDTVSIIDANSYETLKVIETDYNPHELIITLDGKKTYITCSLGNKINILDNETFEITNTLEHPDFNFPHGLGITNDGAKVFMASTYSEKLFVIDTKTDEITNVFPTYQKLSHMISFSPDGKNGVRPEYRKS
ncbi:YncE family protein [Bacillus litorisediminis]|uniref:YncE family protein n=1 Tax=Bacillus litorisediminis TaxID=2922713 RepID=UPI001FAC0481|nr:hypothetical protein [Bacillus litorisediminis]